MDILRRSPWGCSFCSQRSEEFFSLQFQYFFFSMTFKGFPISHSYTKLVITMEISVTVWIRAVACCKKRIWPLQSYWVFLNCNENGCTINSVLITAWPTVMHLVLRHRLTHLNSDYILSWEKYNESKNSGISFMKMKEFIVRNSLLSHQLCKCEETVHVVSLMILLDLMDHISCSEISLHKCRKS